MLTFALVEQPNDFYLLIAWVLLGFLPVRFELQRTAKVSEGVHAFYYMTVI